MSSIDELIDILNQEREECDKKSKFLQERMEI